MQKILIPLALGAAIASTAAVAQDQPRQGGRWMQDMTRAQAQALARFDRDDLNHDGVVTAAERQQVRAQLKAQRGENPGQ